MRLLLLSNSTNHASGYLEHAIETVTAFLRGARVTFVPYALADHEAYTAKVRSTLAPHGLEVEGLHTVSDPATAVEDAEAVFVGGGNTFRLLDALQRLGISDVLRRRALGGMPYLSASAGTNIAGPTIRTTNDMPIVQPASFDALGLVPFQLNPHYLDADPSSTHRGETRQERLREFLEQNDATVLGLREGTWLSVEDDIARIGGTAVGDPAPASAIVFARDAAPRDASGDVSSLLRVAARFDVPGRHADDGATGDRVTT